MKKYSNLLIVIFTFIILILIFMYKGLITKTIITSFYIWFNTLVPSMFPMFVISDILIKYNFTNYLPKKFINFISKIFNISSNASLVFLLSLISGFPTNAINIKTAYNNNLITKEESEHLLLFVHYANPLFILETVGVFYLNNNIYGIVILISHILSSFIIGIMVRNKNTYHNNYITDTLSCQSFGTILTEAIKKSIDTLFMISGTVTLFLILSTLITTIFDLSDCFSTFIKGILEMTMGINSIANNNISDIYKVMFSTMFLSFGGLSIHLQVYSCLDNQISYNNYFIGRVYQTIISGVISFVIMKIFF